MALETGNYISDLVITNPTGADAKSTSDDHHRLIKKTIKQSLPNVSGPITASHTELSYVTGVTSAIQTQINAKVAAASPALTGTPTAPTATPLTNSTQLATTAYTDAAVAVEAAARIATDALKAPSASPTFTGAVTVPTPSNATDAVTKAYADNLAFSAALPSQAGNAGKFVTTNGTVASWATVTAGDNEVYVNYGNGLGSVNTYVRRFTTTVRNVGTAITYADSATLGASFTINETGLYSVYYSDAMSGGSGGCCIGINTSPTASALTLIFTTPSALAGAFYYTNVGVTTFSSRVVRLTAGDVLRPYNQFTTNGFGDTNFIIRKVGV